MRIRTAEIGDAKAIAAIYAHYVVETAITFEIEPPSVEDFETRIGTCLAAYPWLVALTEDRIVGYAYAGPFKHRAAYDWSAEITVYLDPAFHRQGVGKRLYAVLISALQAQGYHSLFAGITLPNAGSVGLHRAIGMAEVGVFREAGFKLGQWHDVAWYGMIIGERKLPVEKPITFPELRVSFTQ